MQTSQDLHRLFYEEIQRDIESKKTELEELESVCRYHRDKMGQQDATVLNGTTSAALHGVKGKTRHEAAEMVLRNRGFPMKAPEIADALESAGYEPTTPRDRLLAGLFTAMDRKDQTFVKLDNAQWGLREWEDKGKEISASS